MFLQVIRIRNLLSFGPDAPEIELKPLNVVIGPNASGKSNLIEAIDLLRSSARDLTEPIRLGGGIYDWLWKGSEQPPVAEIDAVFANPKNRIPLRHRLSFAAEGQRFFLIDEAIENAEPAGEGYPDVYFYYRFQRGKPVALVPSQKQDGTDGGTTRMRRELKPEDVSPNQSILSQRRDPDSYPEITYLATQYLRIKLYREWSFGRAAEPRRPQKTDLPHDALLEDATNLALVLNHLELKPGSRESLLEALKRIHPSVVDFTVVFESGTVQLHFYEEGLKHSVPATRLSDGALHYLCLLAILCHPSPPPLICIEEPEIGLHPDMLPGIADLLISASKRTQIVVTTHSPVLVDAFTSHPEYVLVCEKHGGSTEFTRLSRNELEKWLKDYASLGDLWTQGQIGGTRW